MEMGRHDMPLFDVKSMVGVPHSLRGVLESTNRLLYKYESFGLSGWKWSDLVGGWVYA